MRQLVRMRLAERRTGGHARNVGFARGALAAGANVGNAQHVRHQQVGHGETIGHQPVAFGQHGLELGKSRTNPRGPAGTQSYVQMVNFPAMAWLLRQFDVLAFASMAASGRRCAGHTPSEPASIPPELRSEEHTSELPSLMRNSYAD